MLHKALYSFLCVRVWFFCPPASSAQLKGSIEIWGCRGDNNTAGVWFHRPSTVRYIYEAHRLIEVYLFMIIYVFIISIIYVFMYLLYYFYHYHCRHMYYIYIYICTTSVIMAWGCGCIAKVQGGWTKQFRPASGWQKSQWDWSTVMKL